MAKTIIFDLGGVLVHLHWDRLCESLAGLSSRSIDFVRSVVINGPIVAECMRGALKPLDFQHKLCDKLGIEITYEAFADIWDLLLSPNEGINPIVRELEKGYRLVLGSNTDPIHFAYSLEQFAVLKHFDRFFLSYEMGLLKPDPAFFLEILHRIDMPPCDCLFIDDRPENLNSARTTGIAALVFEDNEKLQTDLAGLL